MERVELECPRCGHGIFDASTIEWVGAESVAMTKNGPGYAIRYEERCRCTQCGDDSTVLRQGTGYWGRKSWDAEQDADYLVPDQD